MPIKIKTSPLVVEAHFQAIATKQLPFAALKTATDLASSYRDEAEKKAHRMFIIRKNWTKKRGKYGFKIKMANRNNLKATVYSLAPWLDKHEGAGTRTPSSGGSFRIPTANIRRTKSGLVSKRDKATSKTDKAIFRKGKGIFRRMKKGKLKYMYSLTKTAKMPVDMNFAKGGAAHVRKNVKRVFERNLYLAIRTAR